MVAKVNIEVAYALPDKQYLLSLEVEQGTTIEQAILQSGIMDQRSDIDLTVNRVGVFSRMVKLSDQVKQGDRIEIYRPLLADPKEIRRRRAEQAKNKTLE